MINELKKMGWEVDVIHERNLEISPSGRDCILPCGGRTIVTVVNKQDKSKHAAGLAICSDSDNYVKKIGRNIALYRAISQIKDLREKYDEIQIRTMERRGLLL